MVSLTRGLKLAELLLQGVAFAANRIIAVSLPEHSRIGADSRDYRDPADHRQHRQHVQDVDRHPELEDAALVI